MLGVRWTGSQGPDSQALHASISVVALIATGVLLTLIPFWTRALSSWSPAAVVPPLCVVASVALTALLLQRAPRWARAAVCGLVGGAAQLWMASIFYNASAFEWVFLWSVLSGALLVAVLGSMLVGIYQARR
jgi:hypothetical protein